LSTPIATLRQQLAPLMRAQDWVAAERACREFTALHPELAAAWIAQGQVSLAQGLLLAARAAAATAEQRAGNDPILWDLIGTLYSRANDQQRALAAYERALLLSPDDPALLFNRAAARRFLGQLELAEADYDRVIALRPSNCEAHWNRSELRTQTPERNHVAELERLLARTGTDWRGAVQLRYALAKEYEDLGDHARSFERLDSGARMRRQHMRYDPATDLATVDWIIESFPQQRRPAAQSAAASGPDAPIFVLGLPRAGSTLVERILGSHSQVAAAGELRDLPLAIVDAARRQTGRAQLSRRELIQAAARLDFAALGRDYLERAHAAGAPRTRFTDKMPLNYLYCGLIRRALPGARIVHVHRHPMAACYAMYKTLFEDGYPFSYDLAELARHYLAYRRLMQHWRADSPESIYELRYEALVADPSGETRRLLDFCGLDWEDACAQFHRSAAPSTTASAVQVRRPIYDTSVAQWRNYRQQLAEVSRLLAEGGVDVD
jgi:tetratricopeptide (TPR) repeat protein